MFEDNVFKADQIPHIATKSSSGNTVTVYRCGKLICIIISSCLQLVFLKISIKLYIGDHIDISRGPMIASTSLVGRCSIAAVSDNFVAALDSRNSGILIILGSCVILGSQARFQNLPVSRSCPSLRNLCKKITQ
jgi:hypothetical protein